MSQTPCCILRLYILPYGVQYVPTKSRPQSPFPILTKYLLAALIAVAGHRFLVVWNLAMQVPPRQRVKVMTFLVLGRSVRVTTTLGAMTDDMAPTAFVRTYL